MIASRDDFSVGDERQASIEFLSERIHSANSEIISPRPCGNACESASAFIELQTVR